MSEKEARALVHVCDELLEHAESLRERMKLLQMELQIEIAWRKAKIREMGGKLEK